MDEKRIEELAKRADERDIFVYTDFLNEQTCAEIAAKYPSKFVAFWGGAEFAERKIARFGNSETIEQKFCRRNDRLDGFEESGEEGKFGKDFPLSVVEIRPLGGKFSAEMRHRDVLGALMALGIVREKVGDIFVADGSCFAVLHATVAQFAQENLNAVGRNNVEVTFAKNVPTEFAPKKREIKFSAQSNRIDNIVCGVFDISREKACQLVTLSKVLLNGVPCEKPSKNLKERDVVSARGFGRFVFCGECGTSRKGKTYFAVEVFE